MATFYSDRRLGALGLLGMGGGSLLHLAGRVAPKDVVSAAAGARPAKPAAGTCPVSSVAPLPSSVSASSATASRHSSLCCCRHGEELVAMVGGGAGFCDHVVFGPVPSTEEAEAAVSVLKRIFAHVQSYDTSRDGFYSSAEAAEQEVDRQLHIEHAVPFNSLRNFQSQQREKILNAFHLLQLNPSIQRLVVSLSSDKAVWDAVMKNEALQQLKESFFPARSSNPQSFDGDLDVTSAILKWILENAKTKIIELIDKITMLVIELFHSREREKNTDFIDDALRSSFMLSIMVLIIVIVTRAQGACLL